MTRDLPEFITFTGLDAWTDLDRAAALASRYPIEWGILFSPTRQGEDQRYPSLFAIGRITGKIGNLRLAAHLCGGHARNVLAKASCPDITTWIDCRFGRFQINTSDPSPNERMVAEFAENVGGTAILQCRGSFPVSRRVNWLFDCSGGRGESPKAWPAHPGRLVGYAGGISPDNVRGVIAEIGATGPYWIDMESGVRTDDRLDLDKCEAVCRAVYGDRPDPTAPVPVPAPMRGGA